VASRIGAVDVARAKGDVTDVLFSAIRPPTEGS
jgi:hypothetical protein